jgi:hypothetical protein
MSQKSSVPPVRKPGAELVRDIRRATRKHLAAAESHFLSFSSCAISCWRLLMTSPPTGTYRQNGPRQVFGAQLGWRDDHRVIIKR